MMLLQTAVVATELRSQAAAVQRNVLLTMALK